MKIKKYIFPFALIFLSIINVGFAQINVGTNFNIVAPLPIDNRIVKEDTTERNSIPSGQRFDGLICFVKSDSTTYQLQGGISNSNWKTVYGGGSSTLWKKTNNYLYPKTFTDSVGIGTSTPLNLFEVKNLFKDNELKKSLFVGDSAGYYIADTLDSDTSNVFIGYHAGRMINYNDTNGAVKNMHNVVIGAMAGDSSTNALNCVIIGESAGKFNNGASNNFIGRESGKYNTVGKQNQFIGKEAGTYNISGSQNMAIGTQALRYDTSGDYNVAIGTNAMQKTMNAQSNIALGFVSLSGDNHTFRDNFAAGFKAGAHNGNDANNNIMIGYQTGYNNLGSDNIFQGYTSGYNNLSGNNNIFQGHYSGLYNTTGSYNIFQGKFAGGNNTTGSNNIFQGKFAGANNTTGDNNIYQGEYAGYSNTTGGNNIYQGRYAGYSNTTGGNNIYQGEYAGYSNTTGNYNFFSGWGAGYSNTSGDWNIVIGHNAGHYNTIGRSNIFQGYYAGNRNTTGNYNIFQGHHSGTFNTTGSNNIFQGLKSGFNNTTGSYNIFQGYASGEHNTIGNNNIYIGFQAGLYDTLGSNNVFLGHGAGYNETGSNKLYMSGFNTSDPLIYGEFDNRYLRLGADSTRFEGIIYADTVHSHAFVGMSDFQIGEDGEDTYVKSDSLFIGDTVAGNYTLITDNGTYRYGTARHTRFFQIYASNMYAENSGFSSMGTYNGVDCNASGLTLISSQFVTRSFDSGSPEAAIYTFTLPKDYVYGTDITIEVNWTSSSSDGNVSYGVGIADVTTWNSYDNPYYTYVTGTTSNSSSSYKKNTTSITFTTPHLIQSDDVGLVIYRKADDGSDTMNSDALVSTIKIYYTSNR